MVPGTIKSRLEFLVAKFSKGKYSSFAKDAEIPVGTFQAYFNGKRVPSDEHLLRIRKKYEISIDWLLTGESEMFVGGGKAGEVEFIQKPVDKGRPVSDNKDLQKIQKLEEEVEMWKDKYIAAMEEKESLFKENAALKDELHQLKKNNPGESPAKQVAS